VPLIDRLTISAGPRFTWKSTKAVAPYFGVDAVHSLASGLPVFEAKGSAYSVGLGGQVSYRINPQWQVRAYVEYEKLLGDAADSPLVKLRGSSNQTTVGLGASYSFDFKVR
jgi:MipA family protein